MSRRATGFLVFFLASQLLLALSYYVCRGDKRDERFAWRMFSTVRMEQCSVRFDIDGATEPVALYQRFHPAWINTAKRGRIQVVDAMTRALCVAEKKPVRVTLTCKDLQQREDTILNGLWNRCPAVER